VEQGGKSCDVCHYPQAFEVPDLDRIEIGKPIPRPKEQEAGGVTCASCHLTPEGNIRTTHDVDAPHPTVVEPRLQTSAMCAYCHSVGKRVVGKQSQTFLEWRDDFFKPGLGGQHCQDCHMPRTLRKTAEDFDVPIRPVARHLWTGGHSKQRVSSAMSFTIVHPREDIKTLEFHVINMAAGHSVPTASVRRSVYLKANVRNGQGQIVQQNEWLFSPWYGDRPDDRAFLEEDKKRPDAFFAMQSDAQGPHEAPVRAGEGRVLTWTPDLKPGSYLVEAQIVFDLNRFNDSSDTADQTPTNSASLKINVK
jgi:hypothetical protein